MINLWGHSKVRFLSEGSKENKMLLGINENKFEKIELPFSLREEKVDENWEPDIHQEYLVIYDWHKGNPEILVGKFSKTWYGFTFHWYWSASSLQLSTNNKNGSNPDWKHFKQVFKLIRDNPTSISVPNEDFITNKDIEI